jgi:metal-sulfur cluster biosynthetic enzyme
MSTAAAKEGVLDALENCYDPEVPVNVVDLGSIYGVNIEDQLGIL